MIELSEELGSRLVHLENLRDGWFDDSGTRGNVIDESVFSSALTILSYTMEFLPEPFLCPLEKGGIGLEWQDCQPCSPIIDVHNDRYELSFWSNGILHRLSFWLHQVEYLIIALENCVTYK